jgi:hypothetical protein
MAASTGAEPDPDYDVGDEWRHVQRVAGVKVLTYIDTGGSRAPSTVLPGPLRRERL